MGYYAMNLVKITEIGHQIVHKDGFRMGGDSIELDDIFSFIDPMNLSIEDKAIVTIFLNLDYIQEGEYIENGFGEDTVKGKKFIFPFPIRGNKPKVEVGDYIFVAAKSFTTYYKVFHTLEEVKSFFEPIIEQLDKDPLEKYIKAHNEYYDTVLEEVTKGIKDSHWMWFMFPQIYGLGRSSTSIYYSIKSKKEAMDYYNHPLLGEHLVKLTRIILDLNLNSITDLFSYPDDLKFKSSMTLFYLISKNPLFKEILDKYYDGQMCESTSLVFNL